MYGSIRIKFVRLVNEMTSQTVGTKVIEGDSSEMSVIKGSGGVQEYYKLNVSIWNIDEYMTYM